MKTSHKTLPWESKGPLSKMAPFLDDIAAHTPFSWYSHMMTQKLKDRRSGARWHLIWIVALSLSMSIPTLLKIVQPSSTEYNMSICWVKREYEPKKSIYHLILSQHANLRKDSVVSPCNEIHFSFPHVRLNSIFCICTELLEMTPLCNSTMPVVIKKNTILKAMAMTLMILNSLVYKPIFS